MAVNLATLTVGVQNAFIAGGGVPGNPLLIAMSAALAGVIYNTLTVDAVVQPAGLPTPMTAPSGGGPVTGTGKIT